jgi:hypothetical protein
MPKGRTLTRGSTLLLAISIGIAGHSSLARAGDPPQASESRNVGVAERRAAEAYDAYTRKDYVSAVALYLEGYDASPSATILYNIARIYDTKLVDRPLAMTFYRRYITDPGADTERIRFANERLTELRAAEALSADLAHATPGASSAKPTPLATPNAAPPLAVEGERGGWSALRWTGATLGVLGIAGVSVGTVWGLAAASKASTARQTCAGSRCTTQTGVDAAHAASEKATISTVGFVVGGALLAAGTALFFAGAEKKGPERPSIAKLDWDASVNSSELTLGLKGTW